MNNIHLGVVMTIYGFLIRWLMERHSFGEYTGLVILCSLGLLLLGAVGRWFLFRKAGRNPWYACVPFLCRYTLFDLSWHGWIAGVVILLELINIRMSPAIGQPLEAGVRSTVYFLSFLGAFILTFIMKLKLVKSFDLPLITVLGSAFMEHLFNLMIALQPTEYQGRTLQAAHRWCSRWPWRGTDRKSALLICFRMWMTSHHLFIHYVNLYAFQILSFFSHDFTLYNILNLLPNP
jgi:hypothetical protein